MKRIFGFLIGTFVGGLFGAATALLLAPESGSSLRGRLSQRGQGWVGEIQSAASSRRVEMENHWKALMGETELP
ncbi:MAG: hypothetical protein CO094_04065 [Anaerolineae bacterium CG_4_9_14_3_um_filter_57_17]|nr:hypothetical protein [bacterium]NCT21434.1 hypothetical protein [bacterium]OIO83151.1 MAG: hypothetical protein AUK01_13300 [Anaerolineae bacterium CG2_30_57_67]PJB67372.1 MAG: hypothetical protein CO094_04065 [Anaerolineae bacterium CG_4_9_14_3_um_filter_57_17]